MVYEDFQMAELIEKWNMFRVLIHQPILFLILELPIHLSIGHLKE